jgi:hypothetical protein
MDYTIAKIRDTLHNHPSVKIIGMTATPQKVYKFFRGHYWNVLEDYELNGLYRYQINHLWYYRDYMKVLRAIPLGSKGIIYFDHITALKKVEAALQAMGHKTASFWSLANQTHTMTSRQKSVQNCIINHQLIPPCVDILLINAAAQTGVNIKNTNIGFMMAHTSNEEILTQVRGRLRQDLNSFYFYKPDGIDLPSPVPVSYLNRPLTATETADLCDIVRLMRPKGNIPYKWGEVKEYLRRNGYSVTKTTKGHGGKTRAYVIKLMDSNDMVDGFNNLYI